MHLCILTANGIPVKRDVLLEVVRRAKERTALSEDQEAAIRSAFNELEAELEAYGKSLARSAEWMEREG